MQQSSSKFFRPLLSMREEGPAVHFLPCVDNRQIISIILHLQGKDFASFGEILVVAPRVVDFLYDIVENISWMRSTFLILVPPQLVELDIALRRDFASGLVDASIAEQILEVIDLMKSLLASLDLSNEGPIEDGSV